MSETPETMTNESSANEGSADDAAAGGAAASAAATPTDPAGAAEAQSPPTTTATTPATTRAGATRPSDDRVARLKRRALVAGHRAQRRFRQTDWRAVAVAAGRAVVRESGPARAVLKRELTGLFASPLAYVFICVFLALAGVFTFSAELGAFLDRGQADLRPFFQFHPWLYLFLIPAVSMRMWSEERQTGTIELLMTLPIPTWAAVVGKFLAAWAFALVALGLTVPMWVTVNVLGDPDNGAIAAAYLGSGLLAGAYLAVGAMLSSLTKSQTIAFVLTGVALFGLTMAGLPAVQGVFTAIPGPLGESAARTVAGFSTLTRFGDLSNGVVAARDVVYFGSLIAVALAANVVLIELKKTD